jgi:hypothetical protein
VESISRVTGHGSSPDRGGDSGRPCGRGGGDAGQLLWTRNDGIGPTSFAAWRGNSYACSQEDRGMSEATPATLREGKRIGETRGAELIGDGAAQIAWTPARRRWSGVRRGEPFRTCSRRREVKPGGPPVAFEVWHRWLRVRRTQRHAAC